MTPPGPSPLAAVSSADHSAERAKLAVYLFIDTETTGIPADQRAPHTDLDNWPRIVSVSWAFYSAPNLLHLYRYHIIRPDGFTIPNQATQIHGITTERAAADGIALTSALSQLLNDITNYRPGLLVAHNMAFDRPVLLAEYLRANLAEPLTGLPTFCTMPSDGPAR